MITKLGGELRACVPLRLRAGERSLLLLRCLAQGQYTSMVAKVFAHFYPYNTRAER